MFNIMDVSCQLHRRYSLLVTMPPAICSMTVSTSTPTMPKSRIKQVDGGAATYTYDADSQRVRKDSPRASQATQDACPKPLLHCR
jgi:YD repeat-containing protein